MQFNLAILGKTNSCPEDFYVYGDIDFGSVGKSCWLVVSVDKKTKLGQYDRNILPQYTRTFMTFKQGSTEIMH